MFKKLNLLTLISICIMFTDCFDLNDLETGLQQEIEISANTLHELLEAVHEDSLKVDKSMTTYVPEKYITDTEAKVIFISENQKKTFLYKRMEKGEWKQSDLIQTAEIIKPDLQTPTRSDYGHLVTLRFSDNTTTECIPIDSYYLSLYPLLDGECYSIIDAFLNDGFKEIKGATFHEKKIILKDEYGAEWELDFTWVPDKTYWFSWPDHGYHYENSLSLDVPAEDLDIVWYRFCCTCTEPTPEPTPDPTTPPPDSLIIDLVNDTYKCPPDYLPHIDFLLEPTDHKTVLKITFSDPDEYVSGNNYRAALFDIEYGGQPYQWTVNIGDSQSNDGGGGDSGHQSNDAEMQIGGDNVPGSTIYAEGNDDIPLEDKVLLNKPDFVSKGDKISLRVENNYLKWENKTKGTSNSLYSKYLYALDGQPDSEGPVNYDIYAAFNRVIGTSSRNGSGVTKVTITFQSETPTPTPSPTPKPPVVNYTIYNPTYPDDILDVMMEIKGIPGWSDNDWEIEFHCNYVINRADALYGCKLRSCTLEEDYTHKVIRGKGDTERVAPMIFLEVRADSYFGFSGFKVNGINCEGKRVTELPAVWQQIAYQGSPGAYGKIKYAIPRVYNMPGWCDGKWRMDITFSGTVNEIFEVSGKGIYDWQLTNQLHIWGEGEPEYITVTTDYDYGYCPQFRSVSVNSEYTYVDIYTNPWHDYAGCCGEYR